MPVSPEIRILFRAAAGSRRGFGHLVRCRSLARALGVRPLLSVRGTQAARDIALALDCDIVQGSARQLIRALEPSVLVVDDPVRSGAEPWIAEARRNGVLVVTIHDLGIGAATGDLVVDGSVTGNAPRARRHGTAGPAFAILDPAVAAASDRAPRRRGVLIALGGGPRAEIARAIAIEIATLAPDVRVRIAGGLMSAPARAGRRSDVPRNVLWLRPAKSLARELQRADVAIVGGGVSLYEACAAGAAAVAVPVVESQRPAVAAFVARGAALGRGNASSARQAAEAAWLLLRNDHLRRRVVDAGRRLVDGRGAARVARAIERLVRTGRHDRMREAS
jgi:spore coat polysaccharide biosynthesis predicted glycosyltransferase SpsG